MSRLKKIVNTSLIALALTASAYGANKGLDVYHTYQNQKLSELKEKQEEERWYERARALNERADGCSTLAQRIMLSDTGSAIYQRSREYTETGLRILKYAGPEDR